jgi:predicted short-subunit dehydrogenase-like oxidoreductase (DUF2520 family)
LSYSRHCMRTVTIIGAGRIGGALARALPSDRYRIDRLVGRTGSETNETSYNTVSFDKLTSINSDIAGLIGPGSFVFHCSGSRSSRILSSLSSKGCSIGSLHPLVSISSPEGGPERFRGAFFCIEGDVSAIELARQIAVDLGGEPFTIETEKKPLYHAAAVMSSGYIVALFDTAAEMMAKCGLTPEFARELILPLVRSTVSNLGKENPAEALTGPFARADSDTIRDHLSAFASENIPDALVIYLALGDRSLDLALEQGTNAEAVSAVRDVLDMAKVADG